MPMPLRGHAVARSTQGGILAMRLRGEPGGHEKHGDMGRRLRAAELRGKGHGSHLQARNYVKGGSGKAKGCAQKRPLPRRAPPSARVAKLWACAWLVGLPISEAGKVKVIVRAPIICFSCVPRSFVCAYCCCCCCCCATLLQKSGLRKPAATAAAMLRAKLGAESAPKKRGPPWSAAHRGTVRRSQHAAICGSAGAERSVRERCNAPQVRGRA